MGYWGGSRRNAFLAILGVNIIQGGGEGGSGTLFLGIFGGFLGDFFGEEGNFLGESGGEGRGHGPIRK